jgi:G3E family GTPase
MVGGFLGAGKTTLLSRLARHYQEQGLRVGMITNDQADNLVDTISFLAQGLATEEIRGGCFCCRFAALTEAAGNLLAAARPDILLAEPVGSCTDLVATVVQPLKRFHAGQYIVSPYVVLLE